MGKAGVFDEPDANCGVVRLRGVSKQYPGAHDPVIHRLDLDLAAGEAVALVGRSGSGKTTLINLIAGLTCPDSGRIRVAGQALEQSNEDQRAALRRRSIGIVFQNYNLLPTLTAAENLAFPLALIGSDPGRVPKMLENLGLGHLPERFPWQMSGGEQQRLAVGRALIHQPSLVLADEPTGNLDLDNAHAVIELLLDQCRQARAALLLVTHSSELSATLDRVVEIRGGALVAALR